MQVTLREELFYFLITGDRFLKTILEMKTQNFEKPSEDSETFWNTFMISADAA